MFTIAKNLVTTHLTWVSGAALIAYAILGVFLGRTDTNQALTDLVAGAGLLNLHFKTQ